VKLKTKLMKLNLSLVLLLIYTTFKCDGQNTNSAALNFPLPKAARYTVTDQQFEAAKKALQKGFLPDTNQLAAIISSPCMCGPGLWHILKDSPHFSTPPRAKTVCKVPLANGKTQELPAALIQNEAEAMNFRAALADLISKNGDIKFRLPTEKEFKTFWAVYPFDEISEPLIVTEGNDYNVIISFSKGKPFWFDEVKSMGMK
jgi:hypothetical protein